MEHQLIKIGPPPVAYSPRTMHNFEVGETPPDLSHKNPPLKWVPYVDGPVPAYDPELEYIQAGGIAVSLTEVTRLYNKVAFTAEQLAAKADDVDRDLKKGNVANAVATLRDWATQSAGTTVTSGNAVTVLQTMVDRVGVFFDRFADLIEGQRFDK